jgi:hypothetical protein
MAAHPAARRVVRVRAEEPLGSSYALQKSHAKRIHENQPGTVAPITAQ